MKRGGKDKQYFLRKKLHKLDLDQSLLSTSKKRTRYSKEGYGGRKNYQLAIYKCRNERRI